MHGDFIAAQNESDTERRAGTVIEVQIHAAFALAEVTGALDFVTFLTRNGRFGAYALELSAIRTAQAVELAALVAAQAVALAALAAAHAFELRALAAAHTLEFAALIAANALDFVALITANALTGKLTAHRAESAHARGHELIAVTVGAVIAQAIDFVFPVEITPPANVTVFARTFVLLEAVEQERTAITAIIAHAVIDQAPAGFADFAVTVEIIHAVVNQNAAIAAIVPILGGRFGFRGIGSGRFIGSRGGLGRSACPRC
jgi:hypothetical protein